MPIRSNIAKAPIANKLAFEPFA